MRRDGSEDVRGLYEKFTVTRNDGDELHAGCRYFVLDLTHDPIARLAASNYAMQCRADGERMALADDLDRVVAEADREYRGWPCPGPCGGANAVHSNDRGGLCGSCGPK